MNQLRPSSYPFASISRNSSRRGMYDQHNNYGNSKVWYILGLFTSNLYSAHRTDPFRCPHKFGTIFIIKEFYKHLFEPWIHESMNEWFFYFGLNLCETILKIIIVLFWDLFESCIRPNEYILSSQKKPYYIRRCRTFNCH